MALTDAFKEAVQNQDIMDVRIMIKNSLLFDLSFAEFNEKMDYAQSMSGLYDEHDGEELIKDKSQWNDEYMDLLMVQVVDNFSHERLDHLKEVVRYLRPVQAASSKPSAAGSTVSSGSSRASSETNRQQTVRQETAKQKTGSQQNRQTQIPRPQPRVVGGRSSSDEDKIIKIAGGAVVGGVAGGAISGIAGGSIFVGALIGAAVGGVAMAVLANGD